MIGGGKQEKRKAGRSKGLGSDSSDLERSLCEVEDQPVLEFGRAEIGADDGKVDILESSQRLELDDDSSLNDEVELVKSNGQATVTDDDSCLAIKCDAPMIELDAERVVIDALHKAGAKLPMYVDCSTDDVVREFLMRERHRS